jgi:hypothetical protein
MFLKLLADNVERSWPRIFELIRPTFSRKVAVVDNEQTAKMEFLLAVLASHLGELERVFHGARVRRVREHIIELLHGPQFSGARDAGAQEYQEATLAEYRRTWERAASAQESALPAVAALLHERLGATFSPSARAGAPESGDGIDVLSSLLANFDIRWWRHFTHKYRIKHETPAGRGGGTGPQEELPGP